MHHSVRPGAQPFRDARPRVVPRRQFRPAAAQWGAPSGTNRAPGRTRVRTARRIRKTGRKPFVQGQTNRKALEHVWKRLTHDFSIAL
ncbi:hypothetical protein EDC14_100161 [Hydrogenispora ethanolica]|uniref:Uncharacterized protein n=1 Tax=Hydrogenispora ethanolica TaxID=1082276 RepID=A0A4R1SBB2_HYDET|nr:hypothetical protein EDC14_100161 [Hydrogenispora ethanolica]